MWRCVISLVAILCQSVRVVSPGRAIGAGAGAVRRNDAKIGQTVEKALTWSWTMRILPFVAAATDEKSIGKAITKR